MNEGFHVLGVIVSVKSDQMRTASGGILCRCAPKIVVKIFLVGPICIVTGQKLFGYVSLLSICYCGLPIFLTLLSKIQ